MNKKLRNSVRRKVCTRTEHNERHPVSGDTSSNMVSQKLNFCTNLQIHAQCVLPFLLILLISHSLAHLAGAVFSNPVAYFLPGNDMTTLSAFTTYESRL